MPGATRWSAPVWMHCIPPTLNENMKLLLLVTALSCALLPIHAETVPQDTVELKGLREQYHADLIAATKPIQDRYLARLQMLLRSYTQRGDLAAALAVQRELDALKGAQSEADTPTRHATQVAMPGGTWTWVSTDPGDATTIEFDGNGTGSHGARSNTKWKVTGDGEITIIHPTKGTAVIHLDADMKAFTGTGYNGKPVSGKRFR